MEEASSSHKDEAQEAKRFIGDKLHSQMVAKHYNSLEEKGVAERFKSRIFYMRNFNNWIKSQLIHEYLSKIKETLVLGSPLRVLDMCCGKGGDLLKWQKGSITYLLCTDIAQVSVEQCKTRYEKIISHDRKTFNAEFFTCDSTRDRLRNRFKDPSMELNLVSCQFAFHYSFETITQAECMLRNASECLKVGGYFIGTIPDANQIISRQKAAKAHTFGNEIYSINFLNKMEDPSNLPIFGAKYNFVLDGVVDCPEFLVHFPALVKLAKKYSLKLVAKERFEDYYENNIGLGRARILLEKMQALEPYAASGNVDLSHDDEAEYSHAKEYFHRRGSGNTGGYNRSKVGTLSKSEWEAITLYMVFAFVKVKKTEVD